MKSPAKKSKSPEKVLSRCSGYPESLPRVFGLRKALKRPSQSGDPEQQFKMKRLLPAIKFEAFHMVREQPVISFQARMSRDDLNWQVLEPILIDDEPTVPNHTNNDQQPRFRAKRTPSMFKNTFSSPHPITSLLTDVSDLEALCPACQQIKEQVGQARQNQQPVIVINVSKRAGICSDYHKRRRLNEASFNQETGSTSLRPVISLPKPAESPK